MDGKDVIKIGKILGAAALAVTLTACGGMVSFKNASFWKGDATETISGVLAKPEGKGPFPAVVLLHSCGGLTDNVLVDWPNYLTALGYVTLAVDSFGPRGLVRCPVVLTPHQKSQDAYGGLKYLASLPFVDREKVGVMGFSMGGTTIDGFIIQKYKTENGLNFKAAINMYGSCHNVFAYTTSPLTFLEISIPTMVVVGELDSRIADLCEAAGGKSPDIQVHVLPDAYHAFDQERHTGLTHDYFGNPMKYSWEATQKARALTRAFLAKHLGE